MYNYFWYFIIFSVIGWCLEVAYHAVTCGKFINRGFLNGPVCPIYGAGAVALIATLRPFADNMLLLFLFAVVIASVLEYITGYVLEKLFNMKWWDYSNVPFNIKGYICLKFSLCWGIVGTFLMRVLLPLCDKIVERIPFPVSVFFLSIVAACYIADVVYTIVILCSFSKNIKIAQAIALKLHEFSDGVGEHIFDSVFDIMDKAEEMAKSGKSRLEEFDKLKKQYKDKISSFGIGHRRIIRAFPSLKSEKYKNLLEHLKNNIDRKNK